MDLDLVEQAFRLELEKEAASRRVLSIAQSRSGRRPMSVDTLLKKDQNGTLFRAAREVVDKTAAPRAVREWQAAQQAGNHGYADQIAQNYGKLTNVQPSGSQDRFGRPIMKRSPLPARQIGNISDGGMEAGVDLMMGRAMGPERNQSGYIAQKMYKPDSPIATGDNMTALLDRKKEMTDKARSLSPEAKSMVPAMYGHRTINEGGQVRHVSQHEYVKGLGSIRRDPNAAQNVQKLQEHVFGPMEREGMAMRDVPRLHADAAGHIGGNASNAGMTPNGPKVIDFLPEMTSRTNAQGKTEMLGVLQKGQHDLAYSQGFGSGRTDTGYNAKNMGQLRRDVYRPSPLYRPPPLQAAAAAPAASNLGTAATSAVRDAGTAIGHRGAAPAASSIRDAATAVGQRAAAPIREAATAMTHRPQVAALAKTVAPAAGRIAKPFAGLGRIAMGALH